MAGLGAVVGLVAFTVVSAGAAVATAHLDPTYATLVRNRRIAGGLATVGGVLLAFVNPILGAGVAAGGLVTLVGTETSMAVIGLMPAAKPAPAAAPVLEAAAPMGAILGPGQRQKFGAVVSGGRRQFFGAVVSRGVQRFGGGLIQGSSTFG
jgi:hypothetical protein